MSDDAAHAADERRRNSNTTDVGNFKPFDLILVNDVGSYFMAPYIGPDGQKKHNDRLTIDTIVLLLTIVMGAGVLSFCLALAYHEMLFAMVGTICTLVPALIIYPWYRLHRKIKDSGNRKALNLQDTFSQEVINNLLRFMRKTPLTLLSEVNKSRFNSVMILTNDVFMKRIRQILFESFYNNPIWNNRRKCCHIYDLSYTNRINRDNSRKDNPVEPSDIMQKIAETARCMGTTLWFDEESKLEAETMACIIACGQFTTCYSLMDYVKKLRKPEVWNNFDQVYKDRVDHIDQQLKRDWKAFQEDPFFLYNNMGKEVLGRTFIRVEHTSICMPAQTDTDDEAEQLLPQLLGNLEDF